MLLKEENGWLDCQCSLHSLQTKGKGESILELEIFCSLEKAFSLPVQIGPETVVLPALLTHNAPLQHWDTSKGKSTAQDKSYHLVTRKQSRQRKTILWPPYKIWHRTGCLWKLPSLQASPSSHQHARRGSHCQSNSIQIHLKILSSMSHSMKSLYSLTLPSTASAREAPTLHHFGTNTLRSPYLPCYSAAAWPNWQQPLSAAQLGEQHHSAAQRPVNIQTTIRGSFASSHLMLWLDCCGDANSHC